MRRDQGPSPGADELEQLLAERGNWLMGIAVALTGKHADAEDLLQAALERLVSVSRSSSTRRVITSRCLAGSRRSAVVIGRFRAVPGSAGAARS
jgi:DNA-directed RNA polymerase specialized sigma24 family protein